MQNSFFIVYNLLLLFLRVLGLCSATSSAPAGVYGVVRIAMSVFLLQRYKEKFRHAIEIVAKNIRLPHIMMVFP
jgi:hypothetical protein